MPVAPPVYVEAAPTLNPPRYGLLSAAELVPWDDPHLHNGVEYTPNPNGVAGFEAVDCVNVPADPRDLPDGIPTDIADPVIVYGGFTCRSVGITDTILQSQARARLAAGDVAAVESRIWDATPHSLTTATEVLDTTPVSLPIAVGLLEEWFAQRYGGTPVIHAPRKLGALVGSKNLAQRETSKLTTPLGSVWAFGNYPGTPPASETGTDVWIVATGQVQVRRSDITVLGGSMQSALHRTTNTVTAVAHRTYVVAYDNISAAIPITLT